MLKTDAAVRWLTTAILAVSVAACGEVRGATKGAAGTTNEVPRNDMYLTEFGPNDTRSVPASREDDAIGNTSLSPTFVP